MAVVLVTGASSGIGRRAAEMLRAAGETVVGISRSGRHGTERADLATEDGCRAAIAIAQRTGPIRALVHCAAIGSAADRPVAEQTTEGWRSTIHLNLDAPFFLIRGAWADLRDAGDGRIVLISSTAATTGVAGTAAYSASKAGVDGLARVVAQEGAPLGITCNAILPGWVRTEMSERSAAAEADERGIDEDQVWRERAAGYAAGRVVEADEVAALIAFLASPAASGVSGEEIRVALGDLW
jgi:NAD(P)-dependent dehydrogenase (short-subunit alcohol dehydrogenase family)